MKLSEYKEDYDYLTSKASEVARHLSFAGVAIVWIFRIGGGLETTFPRALLVPLTLFALSLSFDLLHYTVASLIWGSFHRREEKKLEEISEDPELVAPAWYNRPAQTFFALKLGAVVFGYLFVVRFLLAEWF